MVTRSASLPPTLDANALRITLADGHAHVTGQIDATGATLNFSFDVIPNMASYEMPGVVWQAYTREHWVDARRRAYVNPRKWPALWFTTANAQSDVDGSWWIDLIDVLTIGLALLYFVPKFSEAEGSFENQVNDHPPTAPYPRVQHTSAPPGGISLRIALDGFDLGPDGISIGVHVSAKPTTMAVVGPAIVPSSYAAELLRYALRLPSGALPSDPTLRVAWTLTDAVSGAVLASHDDQVADSSPGFEFQPSSFASNSEFDIHGRLYRLFGTGAIDVAAAMTSLRLRGALAPGSYVRWRAQSVKPDVTFDTTSGQWKYGGMCTSSGSRSGTARMRRARLRARASTTQAGTNRSTPTRCPSRSRSSISSGASYATTASSADRRV